MSVKYVLFANLLLLSVLPAYSQSILYFDDFSGDSSDPLNGTTPDTTIDSNVWEAYDSNALDSSNYSTDGTWTANGSSNDGNTSGSFSAFLNFQPELGRLYTLTVELKNDSETNKFASFGFCQGNATDKHVWLADVRANSWSVYRGINSVKIRNDTYTTAGNINTSSNHEDVTVLYSDDPSLKLAIDLKTTSSTEYELSYYYYDSLDVKTLITGSAASYTIDPTVINSDFNYVFINNHSADVDFDSLTLSSTVIPELNSMVTLFACAIITVLCMNRRFSNLPKFPTT